MALALPIAHQLHASAGITALGVMLTGTEEEEFTSFSHPIRLITCANHGNNVMYP